MLQQIKTMQTREPQGQAGALAVRPAERGYLLPDEVPPVDEGAAPEEPELEDAEEEEGFSVEPAPLPPDFSGEEGLAEVSVLAGAVVLVAFLA